MTNTPLQTLKGFRDIFPQEQKQRDYLLKQIKQSLDLFAFQPLTTPTLEYADLLLGKYGDEADKLIYIFEDRGQRQVGLRYDQTVPTARILAQYRHNLPKFFRRYQIQNVFRAENPQKGRYREFTQCDLDIFGTQSSLADAEVLACVYQAFINMGFNNVQILVNDRRLLTEALQPFASQQIPVNSIIQTIDKSDKLSPNELQAELENKGLSAADGQQILQTITAIQPSQSLKTIIKQAQQLGVSAAALRFEPALARGLDYYTNMICEVKIADYQAGSLGGGGRYDQLIKDLGGVDIPAVGFSFGLDRIVQAARQLDILPQFKSSCQVLVTVFNREAIPASLQTLQQLRQQQISAELYPSLDNLGKQLKLANQKNIPWTIIIGEEEQQTSQITLKNMNSGDQQQLSLETAIKHIQAKSKTK